MRKKFTGTPEFIEHFFRFVAQEVRELMAELGFKTIDEMIGRADCLDVEAAVSHWKARDLNLAPYLVRTLCQGQNKNGGTFKPRFDAPPGPAAGGPPRPPCGRPCPPPPAPGPSAGSPAPPGPPAGDRVANLTK